MRPSTQHSSLRMAFDPGFVERRQHALDEVRRRRRMHRRERLLVRLMLVLLVVVAGFYALHFAAAGFQAYLRAQGVAVTLPFADAF